MIRKAILFSVMGILAISCMSASAKLDPAQVQPYLGNWALFLPGGGAGWIDVRIENGYIDADVLWGGGSVVPVSSVFLNGDRLMVIRSEKITRKDAAGKPRIHMGGQVITAKVNGDTMELTTTNVKEDQTGYTEPQTFTGKRIPAPPAAPDLAKVKYGKPITLFNGKNLDGWKLIDPNSVSGWKVEGGVLTNNPVQPKDGKHIPYGNIRTEQEFEDFTLELETNVPKGGNSGIYLRGIYEIQVADTFGQPLDSHNMGGLYSRITPSEAAEKPAGEWQTYKITLCDRHITVILNGKTIINNQAALGCTGGALTADEFKPGPLYLQGDHTGANYRNVVLTPIIK